VSARPSDVCVGATFIGVYKKFSSGEDLRVLVIGSHGFIGGSLGRYATGEGHEVLGIGRSQTPPPDWAGRYEQADVSTGDIAHIVREFSPELVLQAAGAASVGGSLSAPLKDFHAAASVMAHVLDGVKRSGKQPLVLFPSSAAVYGNPEVLPVEESAPLQPISPYGFHKVVCELLAHEYAECFGLNIIIFRLFSVFGAGQRRLLIWDLYKQFSGAGESVWLDGTGSESRDFLHVSDVAEVIFQIAGRRLAEGSRPGCSIINVGSGRETSVNEIAQQIRNLVLPGKSIQYRGSTRAGDPLRWCADNSRLRALLPSWRPRPLAEALGLCVTAWKQEGSFSQHGS
jgi:UDP-glucose 4-epimerase